MTRAILSPVGSLGDVNPFLWIGKILQSQGLDVCVILNPRHGAAAEAVGLRWHPLGTNEDYDAFILNPKVWHPRQGPPFVFKHAGLATRPQFDAIAAEAATAPDKTVLFAPLTGFGARLAREKLGLPLVTVHLQPSALLSAEAPPFAGRGLGFVNRLPRFGRHAFFAMVRALINQQAAPRVATVCREEGVNPPRNLVGEWWNSPDGVICLFPGWFAQPQSDWPPRTTCVGFPLFDQTAASTIDPDLARFLATGPAPILFTPGTAMAFGNRFFAVARKVCEANGWRAIFVTQFPDQAGTDLPSSIFVRRYVPFSLLMPRLAAIVHHGGIGTVSQGLLAGVPQLIMALSHDQPDNGNRLRQLNAGAFLYPGQFTPARVGKRLQELLNDPSVTVATKAIRNRLTAEDPRNAFLHAVARWL